MFLLSSSFSNERDLPEFQFFNSGHLIEIRPHLWKIFSLKFEMIFTIGHLFLIVIRIWILFLFTISMKLCRLFYYFDNQIHIHTEFNADHPNNQTPKPWKFEILLVLFYCIKWFYYRTDRIYWWSITKLINLLDFSHFKKIFRNPRKIFIKIKNCILFFANSSVYFSFNYGRKKYVQNINITHITQEHTTYITINLNFE